MPSRRAALATLGSAVPVGLAGCLDAISFDDQPAITDPCVLPRGPWPTAGGDPGRTGRTATAPPPADADRRSLLPRTGDQPYSGLTATLPVVSGNTVFVGSGSHAVAVKPGDEVAWHTDLDDSLEATPTLGCGALYVPTLNGLTALDPDTGEVHWRTEEVAGHEAATATYRDGTLYTAAFGPVAVDPRTGKVEWRADGGDTLAVGDDDVYTAENVNGTGSVYAVDHEGHSRWHLSPGKVVGSPTVADGTVYVVTNSGVVLAIEAETGVTRWSRSLAGVKKVHSGVAARGETLVVPAGTGEVSYALDAKTGETRWRVGTGIVTGRPLVGGDWVALGRTNEGVSLYDLGSGEHRRTWTRDHYDFGTVAGLAPVEGGFVVRGGSSSALTLLA